MGEGRGALSRNEANKLYFWVQRNSKQVAEKERPKAHAAAKGGEHLPAP